jgi:hypothetical protein
VYPFIFIIFIIVSCLEKFIKISDFPFLSLSYPFLSLSFHFPFTFLSLSFHFPAIFNFFCRSPNFKSENWSYLVWNPLPLFTSKLHQIMKNQLVKVMESKRVDLEMCLHKVCKSCIRKLKPKQNLKIKPNQIKHQHNT